MIIEGQLPPDVSDELASRIAPTLEALVVAMLDREDLEHEVIETKALRRSDEMKTALLRSASHDLRTPLTAIVTAGELLHSQSLTETERTELADAVVGEATRLSNLVDKLLDLSRLEAGSAEPRVDWCSLDELFAAASEHVGDAPVEIKLGLDAELPLIRADAAQLERAFANLLENAVRHSDGQPVQIRGRVVGDRIVVRVVDRGPGIPESELDRIFEPFYQGSGGAPKGGSGLGLAIARGLVETNGGRVWAESLPGQGAVFVAEFPLDQEEPALAGAKGRNA